MSNKNYVSNLCMYDIVIMLCDKFKKFCPISYDEPNDPRLVSLYIMIDCYTAISLGGAAGSLQCTLENISVYSTKSSKRKSIREPTDEEIRRKWFTDSGGKTPVYEGAYLFDDSNEIWCNDDVSNSELDSLIEEIENALISIGYDLNHTN